MSEYLFGNYPAPVAVTQNTIVFVSASGSLNYEAYDKLFIIQNPANFTLKLPLLRPNELGRIINFSHDYTSGTTLIQPSGSDKIHSGGVALTSVSLTSGAPLILANAGSFWILLNSSALQANLDSPVFTGTPRGPTPPLNDNSTRFATTAWYANQASSSNPLMDGTVTPGLTTDLTFSRGGHRHPTDTSRAALSTAQAFSGGQRGTPTVLTFGTTITINLALANNFELTLIGNATLGVPSNIQVGQSGVIAVKQDPSGGRTLAYNATAFRFAGGQAPSLSIAPGATDLLVYYVYASGTVFLSLLPGGV